LEIASTGSYMEIKSKQYAMATTPAKKCLDFVGVFSKIKARSLSNLFSSITQDSPLTAQH